MRQPPISPNAVAQKPPQKPSADLSPIAMAIMTLMANLLKYRQTEKKYDSVLGGGQ